MRFKVGYDGKMDYEIADDYAISAKELSGGKDNKRHRASRVLSLKRIK